MTDTGKLQKAMRDIASKKGPFALFAVFMRADAPGSWDLVVSAPWLESGKLKALGEFASLLSAAIGETGMRQLSRIVALNADDQSFKALVKAFAVEDGELRVQKSNLFGLEIEDAIIFRAQNPARMPAGAA